MPTPRASIAPGPRAVVLVLALAAGLPGALAAQGTIRGIVHDSLITRAPLAGATVMVHGTSLTATTDRRGRFEIAGLPAGRHAVGFFHPLLDSLDIGAPARLVEIPATGEVTVALAIPSANGLSLRLCGHAADSSTAVVYGTVRAAEDGAPLEGAVATVRWYEVVLGRGGARQLEQVARDSTDAEGRYRLCGVPNDIALTLVAMHAGQATGPLHLQLDTIGVARRDVRVSRTDPAARVLPEAVPGDTTPVGRVAGLARLRLHVTDAGGAPVRNAIVGVRGTAFAAVTDAEGRARLDGLPSGSQTLVVRAVALQQTPQVVDLAPGAERDVTVTLARLAVELPSVSVVGRRPDPITAGIQRRLRTGEGRLLQGDEVRDLAMMPTAWARIPGIFVGPDTDPLPSMRDAFGGRCAAEIWQDGVRLRNVQGWELRGLMLNAKRVEVYANAARRPPEYLNAELNPCGVVAIWSQ